MKLFVKDLKVADQINNVCFAVKKLTQKNTKNGNSYKDLILADKTGEINAKIWQDNFSKCEDFVLSDVVNVDAEVTEFQGQTQLIVHSLTKEENYEKTDFIKVVDKDIEAIFINLQEQIKSIKDKNLKKLVDKFFKGNDFIEKFKQAPGAQNIHHAYLGGLMQHTVEMLNLSNALAITFGKINIDLLKTGILLHDIGKIQELQVSTTITRTLPGHLMGHLILSAKQVNNALNSIKDFPEELKIQVMHLILSHHGRLEFGSPVTPMTTEAWALHYLDQLSSKLNTAIEVTDLTREKGEQFSDRIFSLEGYMYAPPKNDADLDGSIQEQTLF